MDYDNDGTLDMISGSYDPGDIYLFRGLGDGKYAEVEKIRDESGIELVHHPVELAKWNELDEEKQNSGDTDSITLRVATFGSWPTTVDWDGDGDLDVLIGSFSGDLFLRTNIGTRETPKYSVDAIQVNVGEEPLHVNMHAAPVAADWDNDGKWDLVVGSGDGAVGWYRNVTQGSTGEPKFEAYRPLIAAGSESKFKMQYLGKDDEAALGVRSQICVVDYDNDGWLDLIVGDYSDVYHLREMTDEEKVAQEEVRQAIEALTAESQAVQKEFAKKFEAGDYDQEAFEEAMKPFQGRFEKLSERNKEFIEKESRISQVWYFRRNPDAPKHAVSSAGSAAESPDAKPEKDVKPEEKVDTFETDDKVSTDQLSMVTVADPVEDQPGVYDVKVTISIKPGWHLYSEVPEGGAHVPVRLKFDLPGGVAPLGKWTRSKGQPSRQNPQEKIYQAIAQFSRKVRVDDVAATTRLRVLVDYEVCRDTFCLPPAQLRQTVEIK